MLISLNDLRAFSLNASDGSLGEVKDLYFHDNDWRVRYLVANSGFWLFGREVLLNVSMLGGVDLERETISVAMTREQIKHAPSSSSDKPVSEQLEGADLPPFLSSPQSFPIPTYLPLMGVSPHAHTRPDHIQSEIRMAEREHADPHLRSANEMEGYHIAATDGDVGKVRDVVVDRENWRLRYFVVDTGSWLTDREVVVAVDWVERIDWHDRSLRVPMTCKAIEDSPPLEHLKGLERSYEKRLYEAYGFPGYWV